MATSKKLTLSADGTTAAVADAQVMDILTTVFNPNECVTGLYGLTQHAVVAVVGMGFQNYRLGRGLNPFA
jgi:uncharacterized protein (DUF2237 family)